MDKIIIRIIKIIKIFMIIKIVRTIGIIKTISPMKMIRIMRMVNLNREDEKADCNETSPLEHGLQSSRVKWEEEFRRWKSLSMR